MKKIYVIVLSVIIVLLFSVAATLGILYGIVSKPHDKTVLIVKKPDVVAVPTTEKKVDETLEKGKAIPDDLGEDYEIEFSDDIEVEQKPIFEAVPIDENIINVLVVGQDTGLEWNKSTRSDSCMVVSYNRAAKSVKVVSIMRDTWTYIEGHGWNRINAAYSFGGIGLLINTINDVYELDIQNYVITGFDEFEALIDALGGLDMELTEKEAEFINEKLDMDIEAGMNHMTGAMALKHARNRRTGDGDFGRIKRQRDLALTAFNKLKNEGDIASYIAFIEFGLTNVNTNMKPGEIMTLGLEVLQAENLDIAYSFVPCEGSWTYAEKDGKSVLSVDFEKNCAYLKEFLYGGEE